MKFLNEVVNDGILVEEKTDKAGNKQLYITGPFMSYDTPNRNNRIYKRDTLLKESERFNTEVIQKNSAFMELSHPENLSINPERICARIVEMWDDPSQKAIMGKALITNTPMGNIVRGILESGGQIGASTRAAGSIKTNKAGINEVQDDFRLVTADVVLNPSGINCYVNPVMESKEYALVENQIIEVTPEILEKLGYSKKIIEENVKEEAPTKEKIDEEALLSKLENMFKV